MKNVLSFVFLSVIMFGCGTKSKVGDSGVTAAANETQYYMTIFGNQDRLNLPRNSHTFAVFVKKSANGTEIQYLSWLPATLNVRTLSRRPETGVNYDWRSSIELAQSNRRMLRRWGPVTIKPELFKLAEQRVAYLQSGNVSYIALDGSTRDGAIGNQGPAAINCIHTVTDLGGYLDTGLARGFEASRRAYIHLSGFYINPNQTVDAIASELGIDGIQEEKINFELPGA